MMCKFAYHLERMMVDLLSRLQKLDEEFILLVYISA